MSCLILEARTEYVDYIDGFCRMLESSRAVLCAGWRILPSMDVMSRPRPPSNEAGDWSGQYDGDRHADRRCAAFPLPTNPCGFRLVREERPAPLKLSGE